MDRYYVTEERLVELKKELENLKGPKRREVAEDLKRAKEYGDLSENAEYAEAKDNQGRVETRIFELEDLVKNAVIIKKAEGSDTVQVGSHVAANKNGVMVEYTIMGSNESNPQENKISNESPLGRAFLGHKVGDTVSVKTPAGLVDYSITKIS